MKAHIISVGDELLIGQVVNSNQAFIAEHLTVMGIQVSRMITVGDAVDAIVEVIQASISEADVVIMTGGLGPTHDDVTREAVCKAMKTDLVLDQEALANVHRLFAKRGRQVGKVNEDQALVPRGCTVIQNAFGTAPGYFFQEGKKILAVLPGVPYEMTAMVETFLVPFFRSSRSGRNIKQLTLRTSGIPESLLAERIGPLAELGATSSRVSLAYLPSPTGVRVRIMANADSGETASRDVETIERAIRTKIGSFLYGTGDDEIELVVGRLLRENGWTLSVAESCTGGLVTDRITNIPGSSEYFDRGFVVYSNRSKVEHLGVPQSLIDEYGAVSQEVAVAMAEGARRASQSTFGLSTTGIAGPTGGSAEKPVGLVWIGFSDGSESTAQKFQFPDERRRFKIRASQSALDVLRRKVLSLAKLSK